MIILNPRIIETLPHFDYINGWSIKVYSCSLLGKSSDSHPHGFYDTLRVKEKANKHESLASWSPWDMKSNTEESF